MAHPAVKEDLNTRRCATGPSCTIDKTKVLFKGPLAKRICLGQYARKAARSGHASVRYDSPHAIFGGSWNKNRLLIKNLNAPYGASLCRSGILPRCWVMKSYFKLWRHVRGMWRCPSSWILISHRFDSGDRSCSHFPGSRSAEAWSAEACSAKKVDRMSWYPDFGKTLEIKIIAH
jgi:hypothetical protein